MLLGGHLIVQLIYHQDAEDVQERGGTASNKALVENS